MKKKVLFLVASLTLMFSSLTVASGMTKGVQYKKIISNGQTFFEYQTKSNFLLNEEVDRVHTLFKKLGESLNAMIVLDDTSKSIQVIKPNVQMITASAIGTDPVDKSNIIFERVFGKAKKGQKLDKFKVYAEIQLLPPGKVEFRLLVEDPDQVTFSADEFVVTPENATTDKPDTTIIFDVTNAHFTKAGHYKIKLLMKYEGEELTIAEKVIDVK